MNDNISKKHICIYESDLQEFIHERLNSQNLHLIICKQGYAIFSFNQKKRAISSGCLLLISSDLITTVVRTSKNFQAYYIAVSNDIVTETTLTVNPDLVSALYYNPVIQTDEVEYRYLLYWFEQLKWSIANTCPNKMAQLIRNSLHSLFIVLENLYPYDKFSDIKGLSSQNKLFLNFCMLICEKCYLQHGVKYYADCLCVTPYYLSRITAKLAGVTPKRMIDEQLIAEIKHLLLHSEFNMNEIADKLHFDSTSYFCKFFRKYTGQSPAEYRTVHN